MLRPSKHRAGSFNGLLAVTQAAAEVGLSGCGGDPAVDRDDGAVDVRRVIRCEEGDDAAKPDVAIPLYEAFNRFAASALGRPVATGRFAAMMDVALVNDGPVTLIIDTRIRE